MPDILVNIDVDDLARGVAFYTEAFGFTVGRRIGQNAVELLGAPVPLYLLEKRAGTPAFRGGSATRSYARHWSPVHLDMVVDDLDAALSRAMAAGATLEGHPTIAAWGRLALLADPFGHGLCLVQFLNRGYDEIADGNGVAGGPDAG